MGPLGKVRRVLFNFSQIAEGILMIKMYWQQSQLTTGRDPKIQGLMSNLNELNTSLKERKKERVCLMADLENHILKHASSFLKPHSCYS